MTTLSHDAHEGNSSFVTIPLTQGYSAIVDLEDADLGKWQWSPTKEHYAFRHITVNDRPTSIRMHRVILERKLGRTIQSPHVDHINGNPLDNRRENLREASVSQNLANQKKLHRKKSSASLYKGVVFLRGWWQASISYQGYRHYLGRFATPEEASQVYDQAILELYGEYATTNSPMVQMTLYSVLRKPGYIKGKSISGFRGVWKHYTGKWIAKITIKGEKVLLGYFDDQVEAARAYDRAVIAAKGKNALTNFPLEDYRREIDDS